MSKRSVSNVRWPRAGVLAMVVILGTAALLPVPALGAVSAQPEPLAIAAAMVADPSWITGAAYVYQPPVAGGSGIGNTALAGFPVHGATFGILSTGAAESADDGSQAALASGQMGGGPQQGASEYDVTSLRIDLDVPAGAECLTLTFRFFSEEFPDFVGGLYNDAFIAELDASTWTTSGATVSAPDNFAFFDGGSAVSVNSAASIMSAADAAGTVYNGATPLLGARTPITPGAHSVYLTVFDMAEAGYDTAVFVDHLVVGASGPSGCDPGVAPVELPPLPAFTFLPTAPLQGEAVAFTAGGSDPDGSIVAWSWEFGDGATSTGPQTSHAYADVGAYAATLTVTDDDGLVASVTTLVHVGNVPPVADFVFSPTTPGQGVAVLFDATASDSDGVVVAWSWDFGDGATSSVEDPTHVYADAGTFAVALTVTDDDGGSGTVVHAVVVDVVDNLAPVAAFTASATSIVQGGTVAFTDSSTDADGVIVSWAWTFGDGATDSVASPSHVYADDGLYNAVLIVTDDLGFTDRHEVPINVVNLVPTSAFTFAPERPTTRQTVVFAPGAADADGAIVSWAWDFGDGATSHDAAPSHQFMVAQSYFVCLTVTDDDGAAATACRILAVKATVMTGRAFAVHAAGIHQADSGYREVTQPTTWASYGHDLAAGPATAGGQEGSVVAVIGGVASHSEVGYATLSAGAVSVELAEAIVDVVSTCTTKVATVSGHVRVTVDGVTILDEDLAGGKNQVIDLPGGIRLTLNEQKSIGGMDNGLRARAVVLQSASGESVLGHAQAGLRTCNA